MVKIFSRKELYDLVWSSPIISITKKYDLSYWEFRNICKKMNIPTLQAGYWLKLIHNKKLSVKPFSEYYPDYDYIELYLREHEGKSIRKRKTQTQVLAEKIETTVKLPHLGVFLKRGNDFFKWGGLLTYFFFFEKAKSVTCNLAPPSITV